VALEVYFQLVSCLEEVVEAASRVGPRAPLPLVVLPPYGDLVVRREVLKLPRVQVVSAGTDHDTETGVGPGHRDTG
jgi:hypothetical protein